MTDLVDRLRSVHRTSTLAEWAHEAANEIERLRKEIQEQFDLGYQAAGGTITPVMTICIGKPLIALLAKQGAWKSEAGESLVAASDLFHADPYAEIEHLRDALTRIANHGQHVSDFPHDVKDFQDFARTALATD